MFSINRRIGVILGLAVCSAGAGLGWGQGVVGGGNSPGPGPLVVPQVNPSTRPEVADYSAAELDEMLAPIALYPDPLLSEVLAAATYPDDVAAAGQWLRINANPSEDEINSQNWDTSVKAVAHFPNVVQMMASQMDWTEALGNAFAREPGEVMDSVQRLRAKALAAQTLTTTPQQDVVQDSGVIEILPAQPDVIYVPVYDPLYAYSPPWYGSWITFGPPCFTTGLFFDLGFDWHHHFVDRGVRWGRDWRHADFGRAGRWEHDRGRPIPVARHGFTAPRGVDGRRNFGAFNSRGAIDPRLGVRREGRADRGALNARAGLRAEGQRMGVGQLREWRTPQRVTPVPSTRVPARSFEGQRSGVERQGMRGVTPRGQGTNRVGGQALGRTDIPTFRMPARRAGAGVGQVRPVAPSVRSAVPRLRSSPAPMLRASPQGARSLGGRGMRAEPMQRMGGAAGGFRSGGQGFRGGAAGGGHRGGGRR